MSSIDDLYARTGSGLLVPKTAVSASVAQKPLSRQIRRLIAQRGASPRCQGKTASGRACGKPISANKKYCKLCGERAEMSERAAAAGLVLAR